MYRTKTGQPAIGFWRENQRKAAFYPREILALLGEIRQQTYVLFDEATGGVGIGIGGDFRPARQNTGGRKSYPVLGVLAPQYPEWLGDRSFQEVHGVRFPYIAGEMANGITSEAMVTAMARQHMLGFFGAAGLSLRRVEEAIQGIQQAVGDRPWGINLIHTPHEPQLEEALVDLYLHKGVLRISVSAFMEVTPAIVRYAAKGLTRDAKGAVRRRHYIFAKISRPELAKQFMSPPPAELLQQLVEAGKLSPAEAQCAAAIPLAEDITVESDSGGHTDNRPLGPLFSAVAKVREICMQTFAYIRPIRLGAAGGIGTPAAAAAAFASGAAYILVGSVNQAAVESGLSQAGKVLLAKAAISDVAMAPASDMFEQGAKVQVLKLGTLFSARAAQLYEAYRRYASLEEIPEAVRRRMEETIFQAPVERIWEETVAFFRVRNPGELERAAREPKHKMALVFRWYLGKAGRWAIAGEKGRELDYQIFCGPAMGSFNDWVKGSFMEALENRTVTQIAFNLLEGAAVIARAQQLRGYGVTVPAEAFHYRPQKYRAERVNFHGA